MHCTFGAGLYSALYLLVLLPLDLLCTPPLDTMSEQDTEQKMAVAKQKKDVGDQAFKAGETVNGMDRHPVSS